MSKCAMCSIHSNLDAEALSQDDSQQALRRLEHEALDAVLHAFRAQGPLSLYKEVLLDHLKTSLFISQDEYIFRVDHVLNDRLLRKVCKALNPSYAHTNANWLMERQSYLPHDFRRHMSRLGRDITDIYDVDEVTEAQWANMSVEFDEKENEALGKLLSVEKQPFAPEMLRQRLVETECSERSDCATASIGVQTNPPPIATPPPPRTADDERPQTSEVGVQTEALAGSFDADQEKLEDAETGTASAAEEFVVASPVGVETDAIEFSIINEPWYASVYAEVMEARRREQIAATAAATSPATAAKNNK